MPTHPRLGLDWADIMQPLRARRRRRVASFAEYVAKDIQGDDPNRAVQAITSLVRRQPAAVDAVALRRAARHAQRADGPPPEDNQDNGVVTA
jgi:hypothetical protein